jgi:hypothetical protein
MLRSSHRARTLFSFPTGLLCIPFSLLVLILLFLFYVFGLRYTHPTIVLRWTHPEVALTDDTQHILLALLFCIVAYFGGQVNELEEAVSLIHHTMMGFVFAPRLPFELCSFNPGVLYFFFFILHGMAFRGHRFVFCLVNKGQIPY